MCGPHHAFQPLPTRCTHAAERLRNILKIRLGNLPPNVFSSVSICCGPQPSHIPFAPCARPLTHSDLHHSTQRCLRDTLRCLVVAVTVVWTGQVCVWDGGCFACVPARSVFVGPFLPCLPAPARRVHAPLRHVHPPFPHRSTPRTPHSRPCRRHTAAHPTAMQSGAGLTPHKDASFDQTHAQFTSRCLLPVCRRFAVQGTGRGL